MTDPALTAVLNPAPPVVIGFTRAAYTEKEWAAACGLGITTIKEHIAAGRLITREATDSDRPKKIITLEDGVSWLRSLRRVEAERAS